MKTANYVLHLLGGIFSVLSAIGCVVGGILLIVLKDVPGLTEFMLEQFKGEYEIVAETLLKGGFIAAGVALLVISLFTAANAVLSFLAMTRVNKNLYITNIIFGVLSTIWLNVAGSIVGLIALNNESKKDDNVIDVE